MKKIIFLVMMLIVGIFIAIIISKSDHFERIAPIIESDDEIFWNFKDPLKITLTDDSGIQNYQIYMNASSENRLIETTNPPSNPKQVQISIPPPKNTMFLKDGYAEIEISATDISHFGFGNTTTKTIRAYIDTQKPQIEVVAHSYKIVRGGAGFVVFRALDDNIYSIRLEGGKWQFKPVYFADNGYYAALIAWDVRDDSFTARIHVEDKAGNVSVSTVPFYQVKRNYKTSTIKIDDSFIDGKITSLIAEVTPTPPPLTNPIEKFNYINRDIRAKNIEIVNLVGQGYNQAAVLPINFTLNKFYPLRNGAAVGGFGDHRYFSYQGNTIGESYHLGIDFASIKQAPVFLSNGGAVAFANFNGIYGNTVIIDHGLGLLTLYAHLTNIDVSEGQILKAGAKIGNTGLTGLVLGDHLHFATLIQGVESNPAEWLDSKWLNDNLFKVIKDAQNIINAR